MADPPDYDDDDLAGLIASLSDLDLASLQRSPASQTPPPRTPSPRQATPVSTPGPVYQFHSPTKSGRTADWSEAAHHTQGVSGASVQRIVKPTKPSRPKSGGYAVFYGRQPGTYSQWSGPDGAGVQVMGVSGNLHQGYPTAQEAHAAFEYARTRGWTGRRPSPNGLVTIPISSLPVPVSPSPPVSSHNPLHGEAGCTDHQWYIVYAGITPGIYRSYLECALNTLSLPGAVHDSAPSRADAERRWVTAVDAGRVRFLTHSYSE
ncbi:hypothetical protein B0H11DRAFT_2227076 [Mycena galericulata]|nr:hypothetical protein B0H11DRAFT_2227076 [Mycena galericulata]